MATDELIKKARKAVLHLRKLREDPRYLKTLGRMRFEGFLDVPDVKEYRGQVFLNEALWAAELEPRVFELLPAILVRRPKIFTYLELPQDLELVVAELRAGHPKTPYQNIPAKKYEAWMELVGGNKPRPKVMRSFRLGLEEVEILERLAAARKVSQSDIIRQALSTVVSSPLPAQL